MTAYNLILLLAQVVSMGNSGVAGGPVQADLSENARLAACGNNCFALQLYQRLRERDGNLFFSPYSISTALAMTYTGARGPTQEQMAEVLCLPTVRDIVQKLAQDREPMSPEDFMRAFGEIVRDLNQRGGRGDYELRVANALWGQQDFEFLASFVRPVEKQFGGHLERVNFVQATEEARRTINGWVEKQTNDKIRDLIGPGLLGPMTRLVLTNAIYFKGTWATQFKKDRTTNEPFTLADGSTVPVPMMNQKATFGYGETDTLQVLEMPYVGQELSMVVLLPKEVGGIGGLEEALTADNVSQWLRTLHRREVIVAMPRFRMTHKFDLGTVLQSMGMTDAFARQADFSRMTGRRDLFISAVVHQAYVDVNEEGTEAAAATGVTMRLLSMSPGRVPVFRADHPFLFLIRDARSGSLLFLGRVTNPEN